MVLVGEHDDSKDSGEVVDFKGNPVDKFRTGGWLGAGLILVTELSERVCVIGIAMNLVTYLVGELHLTTSKSANIVTNFMGTLNLLALFTGFLADAKLGRYLTVAIFATIMVMGVSLLTVATTLSSMKPPPCDDYRNQQHGCIAATGKQLAMLYTALFIIALGGGGIKANVSGFGSDQFDHRDPEEEKKMVFFFNRFYFCISLGSLFAVTVLVYIQDNVGRGWGYGISAGTMALAVLILLGGTPFYRYKKPQGSPLTVIWRVIHLAWKKRSLPYPSYASELHGYHSTKVSHSQRFRCLDKAAVVAYDSKADEEGNQQQQQIDGPVASVNQVEEVKMVMKLLPIWSTCILFWTVYSQMTTFSVEQATFMNRHIPPAGGSFVFPSGSLSFFLFITILLFTSLNEKLLVPVARRFTRNPHGITSLQRVSVGLVLSVLAMVAAAIVEDRRRHYAVNKQTRISAFWLVPQFFLVGAGEAFAYVGQLEFFIREAPERMKSMSTGLFLATISMGFFLSSLLVTLVDKATNGGWIKNNLNMGRLDYFYWLLAVLGTINFIVFLLFASRHQYETHTFNNDQVEEEDLKAWKDDVNGDGTRKENLNV